MPKGTPLSTEAVVAKAMEMARADGIDSVGYNGLARELGIKPQSMYRYVANLRELRVHLLRANLGALVEEIEAATSGLPPAKALREYAVSLYDACHANPLYYEALTLMHRYGVVEDMRDQLFRLTNLSLEPIRAISGSEQTAARRHQLFMAVNLGYAQMSQTAFLPPSLHDDRNAFIASIDELLAPFLKKAIL